MDKLSGRRPLRQRRETRSFRDKWLLFVASVMLLKQARLCLTSARNVGVGTKHRPHPEEHRVAMRVEGWNESMPGSIPRDGCVRARPPQDEVRWVSSANLTHLHQVAFVEAYSPRSAKSSTSSMSLRARSTRSSCSRMRLLANAAPLRRAIISLPNSLRSSLILPILARNFP